MVDLTVIILTNRDRGAGVNGCAGNSYVVSDVNFSFGGSCANDGTTIKSYQIAEKTAFYGNVFADGHDCILLVEN